MRKVKSEGPSLFSVPAQETKLTYTVSVEVDEEFIKVLDEAKAIIGHATAVEVFKRAVTEFVQKRKKAPRVRKSSDRNSRYITKSVRHEVNERDSHQCSFVSKDGQRCQEIDGLQIDHIKPHGLGGGNELENLRLLCPAHNLLLAEQTFGREKIHFYSKGRASKFTSSAGSSTP